MITCFMIHKGARLPPQSLHMVQLSLRHTALVSFGKFFFSWCWSANNYSSPWHRMPNYTELLNHLTLPVLHWSPAWCRGVSSWCGCVRGANTSNGDKPWGNGLCLRAGLCLGVPGPKFIVLLLSLMRIPFMNNLLHLFLTNLNMFNFC